MSELVSKRYPVDTPKKLIEMIEYQLGLIGLPEWFRQYEKEYGEVYDVGKTNIVLTPQEFEELLAELEKITSNPYLNAKVNIIARYNNGKIIVTGFNVVPLSNEERELRGVLPKLNVDIEWFK